MTSSVRGKCAGNACVFFLWLAASVSRNQVGFFSRFSEPVGCVGGFGRVTEVDAKLIRIGDVTFALGGEAFFPELQVVLFQLLDFRCELLDDVFVLGQLLGLSGQLSFTIGELSFTIGELSLVGFQLRHLILNQIQQLLFRKFGRINHASQHKKVRRG